MKTKIVILTPVYNDWKNLGKLLRKINEIFKRKVNFKFDLIIVNDCSKEKFNPKKYKIRMVNKITIISLFKNVGSQRAIAIGIKYLSNLYVKNFKTIIIDSDGQDNPNAIIKMLSASRRNKNFSVAVNRGQRKEPLWFKFFYETYGLIIKLLCAKKIRFGNFSLISFKHLIQISKRIELWSAFPPTLSKCINELIYLNVDREKRYSGKSKMNFFGLFFHALKVFSALKLRIFVSSFLYITVSYHFLFNKNILLFYLILSVLLLLNVSNFIISFNNRKSFENNFKKIKITTIRNN